jgi:CBS domain-containing protein
MKVEQLMTRDVAQCRPDDSFSEAARRMWENDCGALLVVDERGAPAGIVTDRDLCMCLFFADRTPRELKVEHAMAHEVRTCRPYDTVEQALETMSTHQVRRLPVVDDEGRVRGMLSSNDVIRAADRTGSPEARALVHALATICAPRQREYACIAGASGGERVDTGLESVLTAH